MPSKMGDSTQELPRENGRFDYDCKKVARNAAWLWGVTGLLITRGCGATFALGYSTAFHAAESSMLTSDCSVIASARIASVYLRL